MDLISIDGWYLLLRWIHLLAGITWIGLLYYFNFVQGEWFKETEASAKSAAFQKLVPRALWWFRWGAMFTFLAGALTLLTKGHQAGWEIYSTSWGIFILTGSVLGTLMFLNGESVQARLASTSRKTPITLCEVYITITMGATHYFAHYETIGNYLTIEIIP